MHIEKVFHDYWSRQLRIIFLMITPLLPSWCERPFYSFFYQLPPIQLPLSAFPHFVSPSIHVWHGMAWRECATCGKCHILIFVPHFKHTVPSEWNWQSPLDFSFICVHAFVPILLFALLIHSFNSFFFLSHTQTAKQRICIAHVWFVYLLQMYTLYSFIVFFSSVEFDIIVTVVTVLYLPRGGKAWSSSTPSVRNNDNKYDRETQNFLFIV